MQYRRWSHLSCLLSQLRYEKQSKSWLQGQFSAGIQNKTPMLLYFMAHADASLGLYADIIAMISFFT